MAAPGDIVLFTLDKGRGNGQVRPAMVVALHSTGEADLTIFLDGETDEGFNADFPVDLTEPVNYFAHVTAKPGTGPGEWTERTPALTPLPAEPVSDPAPPEDT